MVARSLADLILRFSSRTAPGSRDSQHRVRSPGLRVLLHAGGVSGPASIHPRRSGHDLSIETRRAKSARSGPAPSGPSDASLRPCATSRSASSAPRPTDPSTSQRQPASSLANSRTGHHPRSPPDPATTLQMAVRPSRESYEWNCMFEWAPCHRHSAIGMHSS